MTNTAHKGEVVALQSTHTSTNLKFHVSTYQTWVLATVKRANVSGIVMEAIPGGQTVPRKVEGHRKVYTITGPQQAKARALVASMDYPGAEWSTGYELKAAILAVDLTPKPAAASFVDVSQVTEYGQTSTLSQAVRVF